MVIIIISPTKEGNVVSLIAKIFQKTMEVSQSPNFFQDQLQNVIALSASYGAFAALRSDGRVVTWGDVPWMDRGEWGGEAWRNW